MTSGQITYDLRRLRVHGLIERIPRTHRYQVTDTMLRHALFLTRLHARFLRPGLGELTGQPPPVPAPLRGADRAYRNAIDDLARQAGRTRRPDATARVPSVHASPNLTRSWRLRPPKALSVRGNTERARTQRCYPVSRLSESGRYQPLRSQAIPVVVVSYWSLTWPKFGSASVDVAVGALGPFLQARADLISLGPASAEAG